MKKFKLLFLLPAIFFMAISCDLGWFGSSQPVSGGVLKSVDAGETWEFSNKSAGQGDISGISVGHIRFDPNNNDTMYIASPTNGVYISADGAKTWKNVLSGPRIFDLQIKSDDASVIYAGGSAGDIAKVFKSQDKGQTWTQVYSESKGSTFVASLALVPKSPHAVVIGLSTGEVIKSGNDGNSWDLVSNLDGRILKLEAGTPDGATMYALSMKSGLYKSVDSGATWKKLTGKPVEADAFHGYSAVLPAYNTFYVVSSNGLYRSTDGGGSWQYLTLPLHEKKALVSAVVVDQKNTGIIYAVVNQTLYKSNDSGDTWQTHTLSIQSSVRELVIDPGEQNQIFAALGQALK